MSEGLPTSMSGRVALVTGAASGIGKAVATMLAASGATVVAVDRDRGARHVVESLNAAGAQAAAVCVDLSDVAAIPGLVGDVLQQWDRIDILVNAAAVTGSADGARDLFSTSLAVWQTVMAVNVTAPFLLCQEVGRHMATRGGGGHIVNISSSSAFRAKPSPPAYGCSKLALVHLTRVVAADLGPYDVNVNAVVPGVTRTPIFKPGDPDPLRYEKAVQEGPLANFFGRVSEPEDVAAVVRFLCSPESRQITGQAIHTSAGQIV
jgi:NAD(P)-dependent dehydrogenase (short-subunit alcohol dehydrogenase family)